MGLRGAPKEGVLGVRGKLTMTMETRENPPAVPQEAIAIRAYELYCAHGCEDGHDVDDWLAAEAQLRPRKRAGPRNSKRRSVPVT